MADPHVAGQGSRGAARWRSAAATSAGPAGVRPRRAGADGGPAWQASGDDHARGPWPRPAPHGTGAARRCAPPRARWSTPRVPGGGRWPAGAGPAVRPRLISSRSAGDRRNADRCRGRGRRPPLLPTKRRTPSRVTPSAAATPANRSPARHAPPDLLPISLAEPPAITALPPHPSASAHPPTSTADLRMMR